MNHSTALLTPTFDLTLTLILLHLTQIHPSLVLSRLHRCFLCHPVLFVELLNQVPKSFIDVLTSKGTHREELALVLPLEIVDLLLKGL